MNLEQMNEAKKAMVGWLSHPQELGKAPAKIECAGEFDLHDLHYYIFKYKKSFLGAWLLGVCGGYEDDGLEHCGHIFSNMEPYEEATAAQKAADMVEMIRSYWMEQAKKAEERKENPGSFVNFVLLEKPEWDKEAILRDLKERWQIEDEPEGEDKGEEDLEERDDSIVLNYHGTILAVSLMPGPIPNGEAEANAEKNYMWSEAVTTTKHHQAHLLGGGAG